MPNISETIDNAYRLISQTEQVEIIEAIPTINYKYVCCWKLDTEVSVFDKCYPVTFYLGFQQSTPYDFQDVYCQEFNFGDIPHVELNGKLCLYEDGAAANPNSFPFSVKDTLNKAKSLIRQGIEKTNKDDFFDEIGSYWRHKYAKEQILETSDSILLIDEPTCTQIMFGYRLYSNGYYKYVYSTKRNLETIFGERSVDIEKIGNAIFVKDFPLPERPPYCITGGDLGEIVKNHADYTIIKRHINREAQPLLIFKLFNTILYGGISIDPSVLKTNRAGFRCGTLTNFDVLTKMEWKSKSLNRILAKPYNTSRIVERTSGEDMVGKDFVVIGLGSIGSQLVHFLMAYVRASFCLIDDDKLRVDNVGRHLLGLKHTGKNKVDAIAEHIKDIRPEIKVIALPADIKVVIHRCKNFNKFLVGKVAILCMGDYMADRCFLNWLGVQGIHIPVFILWLEPYAISGHLVYISPIRRDS